jgi:hypothetical protein
MGKSPSPHLEDTGTMKKSAPFLLLCLALFLPHPVPAEDGATDVALSLSDTVKLGSLSIKAADVSLTRKRAYVHVLFDAFPYRDDLLVDSPNPKPLEPVVKALVEGFVLTRLPATKLVKVDVVEFTDRDDYGAARWDAIKRLGKFEVKIFRHRLSIKRLSEPDSSR